jgi:dTDP-4-dehydrorhamnose reductase
LKNEGNIIQGWNNHIWNGITCLEYCKVIQKIIEKNMFWKGVRHILSPHSVSKYELMMMIKDSFNLRMTIENVSTQTSIDKSLKTIYSENAMMNIPDIFDQLKELSNMFNIYNDSRTDIIEYRSNI